MSDLRSEPIERLTALGQGKHVLLDESPHHGAPPRARVVNILDGRVQVEGEFEVVRSLKSVDDVT
jgi:hypothetical protein